MSYFSISQKITSSKLVQPDRLRALSAFAQSHSISARVSEQFTHFGDPWDWTWKKGSPTGGLDVILYEMPWHGGMRQLQVKPKNKSWKTLFLVPFQANNSVDRNRAIQMCVRKARQEGWKLDSYSIATFTGGLY